MHGLFSKIDCNVVGLGLFSSAKKWSEEKMVTPAASYTNCHKCGTHTFSRNGAEIMTVVDRAFYGRPERMGFYIGYNQPLDTFSKMNHYVLFDQGAFEISWNAERGIQIIPTNHTCSPPSETSNFELKSEGDLTEAEKLRWTVEKGAWTAFRVLIAAGAKPTPDLYTIAIKNRNHILVSASPHPSPSRPLAV
jgi:hypothetical protein